MCFIFALFQATCMYYYCNKYWITLIALLLRYIKCAPRASNRLARVSASFHQLQAVEIQEVEIANGASGCSTWDYCIGILNVKKKTK